MDGVDLFADVWPEINPDIVAKPTPGFFEAGGMLDKFANATNPMMKDTGLPPWLKAVLGSGVSFANNKTAMSLGGPRSQFGGGSGGDDLSKMLAMLMKSGAGGSGVPTATANPVASTPVRSLGTATPIGTGAPNYDRAGIVFGPPQAAPSTPFAGLRDPYELPSILG